MKVYAASVLLVRFVTLTSAEVKYAKKFTLEQDQKG